jgi:tight adherence protein C
VAVVPRGGSGGDQVAELPLGMRILWPAVAVLAFHIGPRLGVARRQALIEVLRRAELDHLMTPQHWVGLQVTALAAAAALAAFGALAVSWSLVVSAIGGALIGLALMRRWQARRRAAIEFAVLRELPTYLDVLTLAVEAGMSLTAAIGCCVDKACDSPLRRALQRVLREIRAGRTRAEALEALAERWQLASITSLATALVNAERSGASVGQVLRAQAEQRNAERFARAEKLAMEAPVKMLGPLILCIFPCTFIVLAFPIAMQLSEQFGS